MIPSTYTGTLYDSTSSGVTYSTSEESTSLGQDAFLKMFMAQVTNQDPLNPMDNTEFTAQLATFSQLEQLTQITENTALLSDVVEATTLNTALGYLGKEVTASGNLVPVTDGEAGTFSFDLASAAQVEATIINEDGDVVANIDLGSLSAGVNSFTWDATDNAGQTVDDGAYVIALSAHTADGTDVDIEEMTVTSKVTGITGDEDGNTYLLLGSAALGLDDIIAVNAPSTESSVDSDALGAALDELESATSTDGEEELGLGDVLKAMGAIGSLAALLL